MEPTPCFCGTCKGILTDVPKGTLCQCPLCERKGCINFNTCEIEAVEITKESGDKKCSV